MMCLLERDPIVSQGRPVYPEWNCWIVWQFYFQFFEEPLGCFAQWPDQFTFLPTVHESSNFSTSSPAPFVFCFVLFCFNNSHLNGYLRRMGFTPLQTLLPRGRGSPSQTNLNPGESQLCPTDCKTWEAPMKTRGSFHVSASDTDSLNGYILKSLHSVDMCHAGLGPGAWWFLATPARVRNPTGPSCSAG